MKLRPTAAFWILTVILGALLFASSVPSPLYVIFQDRFGFSSVTLTSVFAVYAIALLVALLVVGSLSDHIGRRPTAIAGLVIQIAAMLCFALADGVAWLFAARILQGLATGTAMGALSAWLIDLAPPSRRWLGPLMGVVGPLSGLALGALSAGLLADYGPNPTEFVFWALLALFTLSLVAIAASPETVRGDGRWRESLRPRVTVPPPMRAAFIAALPSLGATWALGGLILSLGASLTDEVLGAPSHLAGALPIFVLAGTSAAMSVVLRDVSPRKAARGGLVALIAGIAIALAALFAESPGLFLAGAAVAGLGFGPSFAGVFRALTLSAPEDQRAGVVSAVLVVSYLTFSIPAMLAGIAVTQIGLRDTTEVYGALLIAIAALALALSGNLDDGDEELLVEAAPELSR